MSIAQEANANGQDLSQESPAGTSNGPNGKPPDAVERVYVEVAEGVRVPVRKINLTAGEPVYLYDTAGPQDHDIRDGLPPLAGRVDSRARRLRRGGPAEGPGERDADPGEAATAQSSSRPRPGHPDALRPAGHRHAGNAFRRPPARTWRRSSCASEIARGRAILPANINHPESEPMIIGRNFLVKVNANIGNSAVRSSIDDEVEKLQWATPLGRRHGDGPFHRRGHPRHAGVDRAELARADRHRADLPGPGEGRRQGRGLEFRRLLLETLQEQAEQGVDYFTIHAGVLLRYIPLTARRVTGIVSRGGVDPGQVVPDASRREFPLHALPRAVRIDGPLRRGRLAGRRAAARLDCRRQRRGPVRRAGHAWAS